MVRRWFFVFAAGLVLFVAILGWFFPAALWAYVIVGPLVILGLHDALQHRHTILRNFPVIGHTRYFMEMVRPEIQQYFIDSNIDAFPVEREYRAIVYQRAKDELETLPFGTQRDVYQIGYEWAGQSLNAHHAVAEAPRVSIGSEQCEQPYSASLLNVSAMSFGALSGRACLALSSGAREGGFFVNTGEGGVSDYHIEGGGDLVWQIGTGYFGCRTPEGKFDPDPYRECATLDNVKMVELKLSQGAKPGHGGVLPAVKVTEEIARVRQIEAGKTVLSPPSHSAFDSPIGLVEFIAELRELSGGKPVGIKLCVGRRTDFFAICKAMRETGLRPDFITVDGGEGGTGAAPLEFSNSVGMPARDAWVFVHNALKGTGLRNDIKLIASGKIFTGFHMIRALAIGTDLCASARGMMFALGCIQSLRCNTNHCPTGITTQDPALIYGLHVEDKSKRVARFHANTMKGFLELLGAMGMHAPAELRPHHIFRRVDDLRVRNLSELYGYLEEGQLIEDRSVPEGLSDEWQQARPDRWTLTPEHGQYGGRKLREESV